jgi:hypothetical protein
MKIKLAALCVLVPWVASAQEAVGEVLGPAAPLTDDPAALAKLCLDAIANRNWWLLASVGVSLLVFGLRTYGPKWFPAVSGFLTHPLVSVLLPVVMAILGGIITAALAGPVTWPIALAAVFGGLKVGGGAIMGFMVAKKAVEAKALGAAAAAKVETKADAVEVFKKGPNP